jgi:Domain of unknown function (DUF4253)
MAFNYLFSLIFLLAVVPGCRAEKPVEHKKPNPAVLVKSKHALLSPEQRGELAFPPDLIAGVELAAGAEAEPFFVTVVMPGENLKGEKGFETRKLAGFSVHTRKADEVLASLRASLRAKGFLLFRSSRRYGNLPDVVTVIRGNNSYDILKTQRTEAPNYLLDTKAIIAWLKKRQRDAPFMVTGAGPDWLEARFVRLPKDISAFAKKVAAFAPDVLAHGPGTAEKIARRMKKTNGFYLVWD